MSDNPYIRLDEIAAPNNYVAIPTESDLAYVIHFRQICKRYQIDFAKADADEQEFVIRMAEKSFYKKQA